jgi:hypothetical protein
MLCYLQHEDALATGLANKARALRGLLLLALLGALQILLLNLWVTTSHVASVKDLEPKLLAAGAAGFDPTNESTVGSSRENLVKTQSTPGLEIAKIKRWFDQPAVRTACDEMFPLSLREDRGFLSYREVWNELRSDILNTTYHHYPSDHPVDYARIRRFRGWVDHLFGFYTAARLKRSQAYPAPPESVRNLLELIQKRIEDPSSNDPIRIVVMGGSVTTGRDCQINPLNLFNSGDAEESVTQRWCAYASRLEGLLNSVLFPRIQRLRKRGGKPIKDDGSTTSDDGDHVFEVKNVAIQATNSQVGAMVLEHWLLPFLEKEPPHVIISSYSANDAYDEDEDTFRIHHQDWVRAAHNLRPCDDHLPLVVLADDAFEHGDLLFQALEQTGSIYKTASWHNVMAVMYNSVIRQQADYASNFSEAEGHPLFGSGREMLNHPGMGFHMAQAWTLFFNLVGAFHDACTEPYTEPPPSPTPRVDTVNPNHDEDGDRTVASAGKNTGITFQPFSEPLSKYRGRYHETGIDVMIDWKKNQALKAKRCGLQAKNMTTITRKDEETQRPKYSTRTCAYAWMVSAMSLVYGEPVWSDNDVERALTHIMTENNGWVSVDRPKAGWYTNSSLEQPSFSIELRKITMSVDYLTLVTLKSYHPEFADSWIEVKVEITSPSRPISPPRAARYEVDGFHDKKISVSYPHRFRLPGEGGAEVGDTIRATFTRMGGTAFKMSGMAFCKSVRDDE